METVILQSETGQQTQVPVDKLRDSRFLASLLDCSHDTTVPFPNKFTAVYHIYTNYLLGTAKLISDQKLVKLSLELADFLDHEQFALYSIDCLLLLPDTEVAALLTSLRCNDELRDKIYIHCPLFLLPDSYNRPQHPFFQTWLDRNCDRNCSRQLVCGKHLYKYELTSSVMPSQIDPAYTINSLSCHSKPLSARQFVVDGNYLSWYADSKLPYKLGKYRDGQLHGQWQVYFANGKLAGEAHYRMGRRSGEWKMWSSELVESVESAAANKPIFTCLVDLDGNTNGQIIDIDLPVIGRVPIQYRCVGERASFYYLNSTDDHINWQGTIVSNPLAPNHYVFEGLFEVVKGLLEATLDPQL